MLRILFFVLLALPLQGFSCEFHDFDIYQHQFTAQEIQQKIATFLEKDQTIQKFYRLTPDALYVGDLDQKQIDYTLHLSRDNHCITKKPRINLKNMRIAIDPGHFGGIFAELEERYVDIPTENNLSIRTQIQEGNLTYLTALKLKELLEREGATVFISRPGIGQGAIRENFFEWLQHHLDLKETGMALSKIFRQYYNKEDLMERANRINAFSPDLTIVIHYNAHLTEQEKQRNARLTQSNYNLAFIPGAFSSGELNTPRDRYEFLRLIVSEDVDRSLELSEHIVKNFVDILHVPLIAQEEKTSYIDKFCMIQKPGVYSRNLALTRLIHGPLCYGESLVQNNEQEIYRLSACHTSIHHIPCSKRVEEVAQAYFEGIKEYCNSQ